MKEITLGPVEARFADIVWERAPLTTKELVALCEQELDWKRTTTYTVLKKLCEKGLFHLENSLVTVCISKDRFSTLQSEQFVDTHFSGSLPAFLAAFTAGKKPSQQDLAEIKEMIAAFEEGE